MRLPLASRRRQAIGMIPQIRSMQPDHALFAPMCRWAKLSPIEVVCAPEAQAGSCYWAVDAIVTQRGGAAVTGWLFQHFGNRLGRLLHHAVWRRPDGALVDVTSSEGAASSTVQFSPDGLPGRDPSTIPQTPMRFYSLEQRGAVRRLQEAHNFACKIADQQRLEIIAMGYRPGPGCRVPGTPRLLEIRESLDRAIAAEQSALAAFFGR